MTDVRMVLERQWAWVLGFCRARSVALGVDPDDAVQEAWVAAAVGVATCDPARGDPDVRARIAAHRAVSQYARRARSLRRAERRYAAARGNVFTPQNEDGQRGVASPDRFDLDRFLADLSPDAAALVRI